MLNQQSSPLELQQAITALRAGKGRSVEFLELKNDLKIFQNNRLRNTYQDLLEDGSTRKACRFFLEQLYCTGDVSLRDHQVERVLPKLERLLPGAAVETIRNVIYMDYLTELLDDEICFFINQKEWFSNVKDKEWAYIKAFREHGRFDLRRQQLHLVHEVGGSLRKLTRLPFLRGLLGVTRGAAQKANLEDFHNFLSAGLDAFCEINKPTLFFQVIQERETAVLTGIEQGTLSTFT